ncbi:helix-turn-helix domain-containing protein [Pseudobacillus sp. 179-B 2D1 NHS]|uniref:helix-turn-helix domain-containing protein n=1 Tax=Pseudobacillus sp. 179-B 2D1 NHS TaxID=3374292 RepID=UPI00387A2544
MSISKMISQRREELKLSYRELGERIGISHTYIRDVEKEKFVPSFEKVIQIANGLDLPLEKVIIETYRDQVKNLLLEMINLSYDHHINLSFNDWLQGGLPIKPLNSEETAIKDFALEMAQLLYKEEDTEYAELKMKVIKLIANDKYAKYVISILEELLLKMVAIKEAKGREGVKKVLKELGFIAYPTKKS